MMTWTQWVSRKVFIALLAGSLLARAVGVGFAQTVSFPTVSTFTVGTLPDSFPESVAAGDFNGDGKLDLAVANTASSNIFVLLGTGTGSFGPATNFAVAYNPK